MISILLSTGFVLLDSIEVFRLSYQRLFIIAEWFFTILFTLEYATRIICLKKPIKYIFSFFGIIDLLSIVPVYLGIFFGGMKVFLVLRIFRLIRIFRVLKIIRFVTEGNVLLLTLKNSIPKIINFLIAVFSIVIISGAIMYILEGPKNGFSDIPTSIYWAIVTISTVGYGDISPITAFGKIFASFLMIIGYGIIAVPTGIVTLEMSKASENFKKKRKCNFCKKINHDIDAIFCKFCGKKL